MQTDKFNQFLKHRDSLIDQYNKGDLTKEEFIERNYRCVIALGIKPFRIIDNVKKAIYNYQYFNTLAKYYQKKAHELPKSHPARADYFETSQEFYDKKDMVTLSILKTLDYQNVHAYYVKTHSQNLKKRLIEIVLTDYDNLIFHSVSERVLDALISENVFEEGIKESLVSNYINKKY